MIIFCLDMTELGDLSVPALNEIDRVTLAFGVMWQIQV